MKNIKQIAILFLISLMLFSCKNEQEKKEEYFEEEIKPKLVEKYKCYGLDDCLSKYEFQGARDFAGETGKFEPWDIDVNMNKIITAESAYWVNEKEYDRGYKIIKEFEPEYSFGYSKSKKEFEILDDIISSLISDKEFDKALLWALKATDIKDDEGFEVSDGKDSQQKILVKKITTSKKLLLKK